MSIPCKITPLGWVKDSGGLPSGYTLVEYLESTGTQYCGTDFYPDSDSAITLDFMPIYSSVSSNIWCFANADADRTEAGRTFKFMFPDYVDYGNQYKYISRLPIRERQVFYLENGRVATSLEEVLLDKQTFGAGPELTIFRNLRDTTITYIRIYQTVLYQAGEKVRNFVSAVDPNGRPCMYDRISQTPQYNRVEGADFVVGIAKQTQLNKLLANLPDRSGLNTGELQIRLAANLQNDSNFAALEEAASKNWEITQAA